ncbi:DUF6493 family protein [Capnocytophaga sputigena]|uniref:DUF6493 family protein n=1 Tax=Capnocytophaga sputigena TaxID=1019 RepID=UPI0028EE1245|nr:DUF6493 family protein [Capnocytophaga sputigena]
MFEHLKKLITTHDLSALFSFCSNLADNERLALLEEFQKSKWGLKESFWDKGMFDLQPPNNSDYEFIIALFLLTRSVEEYQTLSIHKICGYYLTSSRLFSNSKALHILPKIFQEEKYRFILDLFHSVKPEDREFIAFETYWVLYKAGEIPFDEALFTKNITATYLYDDKKVRYTDLVLHDQEFHDKIFRRLHRYENQMFHDAKLWEDFFVHLQRQGYVFDRKYIPELLESLLNPWKKPHLNWHCRWVEFLEPTTDELLACQQTLFALLSTGNTNLINFALKHIQRIANEKAFDFQSFADNFALCFATPKIAKSQLIGLNILEKHYKQQAPTNPDYREQLAVLFTVPDAKLQEKVANLLTTYFNHEGLPEVIAPYSDYLKGKAQDLLQSLPSPNSSENSENSDNSHTSHNSQTARTLTPVPCPLTPEDLLFLLGDCLRERTPQTIDLFFEGFNQLQDEFPADFKEQLAPYLKQLERHWNGIASVPILRWFLQRWMGDKKKLNKEDETFFLTTLPYLYHKAQHLLEKLKEKNKLPFLSTPTHAPFYIEAEVLMDRLLQYEAQGENPDLHDLVVACNRLLFKGVSASAKEKAQQLKGAYTPAIQYYIGLTDKVQPTEELLPLWTQITRIKHPDGEFVEFANTSAKDFPTVVKPFMIDFWMKTRKQSDVTFHYLNLEDNWNNNFDMKQKPTKYPFPYYNTGNSRKGWGTDKLYQCSLNPHYPEAQILRYIASYAKGNESYQIDYMQTSMQVLLENHLPIYHSGWLFVAAALLFEKKPTRDMAVAYILEHLEYGTNLNLLAQYIGKLLAEQYAPIARFVEFLDIPTRDPKIKAFQKAVVEAYLPLAEKLDKKPTNHKKLVEFIR